MDIQELNFNKDKDIILIQFSENEDVELIKNPLDAIYETFINGSNRVLAISDDIKISIVHIKDEKKEEDFPF